MNNNLQAINTDSSNNGTFGVTSNTTGYWLNGVWYPYQPYYAPLYNYTTPVYDIQIRKVNNGFVVLSKNIEYVFETTEAMNNFLATELGK